MEGYLVVNIHSKKNIGIYKVWNATNGNCELTFTAHDDYVCCCAILPEELGRIVTGSADGTLKIWK